ncbi:GGDEF domain-containing protein [Granulicella tundricola]|uniref:diguanylate cyclase n=1 Tax=Granulicella tundricola (strain ATCC BAA-1859 / DSM 23138 / MP5ACTX9) TaxID=1198114 RepID=E8X1M1_GRATM|nr:GGDEF domain-containing protein [Granulicella tundricola]ADW67940.1 diguanylate cyclase [Granulicella tundricola MP5ACTX9]
MRALRTTFIGIDHRLLPDPRKQPKVQASSPSILRSPRALDHTSLSPYDDAGNIAEDLELVTTQLLSIEAGALNFCPALETRFEHDTRRARSHRLWLEGAIAIVAMNLALILDCLLVHDHGWAVIARETAMITPVALTVNMIVKRNPPRWLREGSIAVSMVIICAMNIYAEGNTTTASSFFGIIGLFVTALFVGVVMRLRFPFLCASLAGMALVGSWSLNHSPALLHAERVMGSSLTLLALGLIFLAGMSLENSERRGYLSHMIADLQSKALTRANQELQRVSSIDKLTSLPNRRTLEERLASMWVACHQLNDFLSVVLIDVDHFKSINDTFGHLSGDQTLRAIGAVLLHGLRNQDDLAGRFGGEEFLVLLPHTGPTEAIEVADRIRTLVAGAPPRSRRTDDKQDPWPVTISCGVSSCNPRSGFEIDDLLRLADAALYNAKRSGRNRVEYQACTAHDPEGN